MMTDLDTTSNKHFASLNRAPGTTWTDATKRKPPHKPLLQLVVLDLVHRGGITSPFTGGGSSLIGQTSSVAFPYTRLDREPFWELVPQLDTTNEH